MAELWSTKLREFWDFYCRICDRAATKFHGLDADINFVLRDYEEDLNQMQNLTKEEFVSILRRQSMGFSTKLRTI